MVKEKQCWIRGCFLAKRNQVAQSPREQCVQLTITFNNYSVCIFLVKLKSNLLNLNPKPFPDFTMCLVGKQLAPYCHRCRLFLFFLHKILHVLSSPYTAICSCTVMLSLMSLSTIRIGVKRFLCIFTLMNVAVALHHGYKKYLQQQKSKKQQIFELLFGAQLLVLGWWKFFLVTFHKQDILSVLQLFKSWNI